MIVIYHDVGGAHSTAVAANIHVNKLPVDRKPTENELLALPTFDKITKEQIRRIIYIGEDEFGTKVYTLGRKYNPELIIPAIKDTYCMMGGKAEDLYVVDTHPTVNIWMKIGGFSSRALGLVSFGRPIVTRGSLKAYEEIADMVMKVKKVIKKKI